MSNTSTVTQFRMETINAFEQSQSLVPLDSITTEFVTKGNQATFLVTDTNDDEAVTRGLDGLIPYGYVNQEQYTATLVEKHAAKRATRFNIFKSQGNLRLDLANKVAAIIKRSRDEQIITELTNATNVLDASAKKASSDLIGAAIDNLVNNEVDFNNITALVTSAFWARLLRDTSFTNGMMYNNYKPLPDATGVYKGGMNEFHYLGIRFIVHPRLPGKGTATETCFMYHKNAIGYALDSAEMQMIANYNEEHDYSFARATYFAGSKILQQNGIVKIYHDGTGLVPTE